MNKFLRFFKYAATFLTFKNYANKDEVTLKQNILVTGFTIVKHNSENVK